MNSSSDKLIRSVNPFNGEVIGSLQPASHGDVDAAFEVAVAAQQGWAKLEAPERARTLRAFADLLDAERADFALLITMEMGKRLSDAEGEVEGASEIARWYADNPPPEEEAAGARVRRVPLGVVVAITPWNVPIVTPMYKLAPALMAGNAVLWKPSELSTQVAKRVTEMLHASGVPTEILHLLPGHGDLGRRLVADERASGVHFTGSGPVGKEIGGVAGARLATVALELGGSNPLIVLADADLERAAEAIVPSMLGNNGQRCTAVRRVIAQASIKDDLLDLLVDRVAAAAPGDPTAPATAIGPLVTAKAAARFEEELEGCLRSGATMAARAAQGAGEAAFPPALVAGLPELDAFRSRELFGPVALFDVATDDSDAVRLANATPFGLSAAVHGGDPERAQRLAEQIEAGVVGINRRTDALEIDPPFAGHKGSGNGIPEGGLYGYAGFTEFQALYGGV